MSGTLFAGEEKLVDPSTSEDGDRPSLELARGSVRAATRPGSCGRCWAGDCGPRCLAAAMPVWEAPPGRTDPVERLTADSEGRIPELVPAAERADAQLGVRLLPGQRLGHGRGPGHDTRDRASRSSCAGTRTCRTSAATPRPSGTWCSTSTTSTRRFPGPWEWDVKRLATSLEVAGRDRGFDERERRTVVHSACAAYRQAMREFAELGTLQVWYSRLSSDDVAGPVGRRRPGPRRPGSSTARWRRR